MIAEQRKLLISIFLPFLDLTESRAGMSIVIVCRSAGRQANQVWLECNPSAQDFADCGVSRARLGAHHTVSQQGPPPCCGMHDMCPRHHIPW